jgi:pimeloyl-ACP methyl ester carboxylesterase
MPGFNATGTPAKYNKVGVIKVGPAKAKNVLVLEPGTSAGGAYFVPLAQWIVAKAKGWQVWSIERRENLLEDQSEVNLAKQGKATTKQLFDYYLGYLTNPSITPHYKSVDLKAVAFADNWGMRVAVEDLHRVIASARKLGGRVVLGGHSLGGSVVTAYATWNFGGRAGARDLNGLVYIDGGSGPTAVTVAAANKALSDLHAGGTPWLTFGGIPAPLAGTFNVTGSLGALLAPNAPSTGFASPIILTYLKPPVPPTNLAQYGYALNVGTSPPGLAAAQGHLGRGVVMGGNSPHGWDSTGALTPIKRFAQMFSGQGILNADGTEWYFPQRLTDDTGAVAEGNANPAQSILDVRATKGHSLQKSLLIYAFGAALGGPRVLTAAKILAQQSRIPLKNLTLINRQSNYAHNDPAGAYPNNVFFSNLLPFLKKVAAQNHA